MSSMQDLSTHTAEEERCPQHARQQESIDQHKMDLIESHWGARWEKIYQIIFPSLPIPSPCKYYVRGLPFCIALSQL